MEEITIAIKEVVTFSSQLTTWALSILAGTVATIISTSYVRPKYFRFRLVNLLFIPGWLCLALSVSKGEEITRKYLASLMVKSEHVVNITSGINNLFSDQRLYLFSSLLFFGAWLLLFLLQWVFVQDLIEEK